MNCRHALGCGLGFLLVLALGLHGHAAAADAARFRAGAARIDVTPPAAEMPKPFGGVFEPIFARVIVVDNGKTRAVLATLDVAAISEDFPARLTASIAKEAAVPPEQVMLAPTHAHDSLRVGSLPEDTPLAISPAFNARVEAALVEGVRQSIKNLQPARLGFGRGKLDLTGNEMEWDPRQMRYVLGADRSGLLPSDKSVYVVRFETMTGEPIALLGNYAFMPIVHVRDRGEGNIQRLGGDVPDATSLYLEQTLGHGTVAVMTMAGADQHPLYQITDQGPTAVERSEVLTRAYGVMLGEEVLAISHEMQSKVENGPIYAATTSAICPGKSTTPKMARGPCSNTPTGDAKLPLCSYKEVETPPVTFRMGLMLIGDIAIGGFEANVDVSVIRRVQAISPYANTLVVTESRGPAGYIVSDQTYGRFAFNSVNSDLKMGCGEQSAVKAFQDMSAKLKSK
jgi:hypothetical protein